MKLKILALHILTDPSLPLLWVYPSPPYQDRALAGGATPLADPVPTDPGSAKVLMPANR